MLIDTHCHINVMLRGYKTKVSYEKLSSTELKKAQEILKQAQLESTELIINVGTDLIESLTCIELAQYLSNCYAIVGIHPNDIKKNWKDDYKKISEYVQNHIDHKIIGIGESGIDFHYENYDKMLQQDAFKAHIELALKHDLALSIHSRDAAEETFKIIDIYRKEDRFRGIMHCFSYNQAYADQAIESKLALGIGGTVTYPKNHELRSIVQHTDLEHIVLETDAPFLSPQIVRGKENCPAHIKIIAQFIANLKNISYEQVEQITTTNVKKLFKLA